MTDAVVQGPRRRLPPGKPPLDPTPLQFLPQRLERLLLLETVVDAEVQDGARRSGLTGEMAVVLGARFGRLVVLGARFGRLVVEQRVQRQHPMIHPEHDVRLLEGVAERFVEVYCLRLRKCGTTQPLDADLLFRCGRDILRSGQPLAFCEEGERVE